MSTLRAFLFRQLTPRNKAGALLAMLTCPCHVVMLVFVLGGTVIGTWLAAIQSYLLIGFTALFVVGLWLMVRRSGESCERCDPEG